jgi:hypothetical protein
MGSGTVHPPRIGALSFEDENEDEEDDVFLKFKNLSIPQQIRKFRRRLNF